MFNPNYSEINGHILMTRGDCAAPDEVRRLERRLARERKARLEAEAIAERGMRKLYEKQREILWLARTDELTGLHNRRHLFEALQKECQRARRHARDISCLMLDVDGLKRCNDLYGHQVGDMVLQHVASVITTVVRTIDVVCRYGGDEFCILLPDTGLEGATCLAERIRLTISDRPCQIQRKNIRVSVSIGVSCSDSSKELDTTKMLNRADIGLRRAKRAGRNRVSSGILTGAH